MPQLVGRQSRQTDTLRRGIEEPRPELFVSQNGPCWRREYKIVGLLAYQVPGQLVDQESWDGHRSPPVILGRASHDTAANFRVRLVDLQPLATSCGA
jgi:hypothetical protein